MSTHDPVIKAHAAELLATGLSRNEVCGLLGINRSTLYRWEMDDPDFISTRQRIVDGIVDVGVSELRALVPEAMDALRRGVRSTYRQKLTKDGEIVELRDNSLAVQTADRILKRIPEFSEQLEVNLSGTLEARIAEFDAHQAEDAEHPGAPED